MFVVNIIIVIVDTEWLTELTAKKLTVRSLTNVKIILRVATSWRLATNRNVYKICSKQLKSNVHNVKTSIDGSPRTPKPTDTICSDHFVGGKKAEEEASPSYIPTIFPSIYKKPEFNEKNTLSSMPRKFRLTRKKAGKHSKTTSCAKPPMFNLKDAQIANIVAAPEKMKSLKSLKQGMTINETAEAQKRWRYLKEGTAIGSSTTLSRPSTSLQEFLCTATTSTDQFVSEVKPEVEDQMDIVEHPIKLEFPETANEQELVFDHPSASQEEEPIMSETVARPMTERVSNHLLINEKELRNLNIPPLLLNLTKPKSVIKLDSKKVVDLSHVLRWSLEAAHEHCKICPEGTLNIIDEGESVGDLTLNCEMCSYKVIIRF